MPRRLPPVLPALAALLFAGPADRASAAPGWPEFRGPQRAGSISGADFPTAFGPKTNVLWVTPMPAGHSSPIVSSNLLFLTGFESHRLLVLAHERASGHEVWRRWLEPGVIESGSRLSHPATSTPVTDGERVVAYFAPFGLIAFDTAGHELWRHPLPTPVTQHGASSSPTLAGDLVLQLCDQDVDSYLLALDKTTGRVRWRARRDGFRRGFSTPLPWPAEHPEFAVVAGTLRMVAYNLSDGSERWSVGGLPNEMVASPIPGQDSILVAGWTYGSGVSRMPAWNSFIGPADLDHDGRLGRDEAPAGPARQHFTYIDADKDGRVTQDEYENIARVFNESKNVAFAVRPDGRGDITGTHVLWRQSRGLPYVPTPLLLGNRLFLVRNGGLASCLDARTGEYRFQEERLGALGDYYSSPVGGRDKVLIISQAGVAVVFRASDTLEVLARNELGEQVLATPALANDGTLHVRTASRLYAFRSPRGP